MRRRVVWSHHITHGPLYNLPLSSRQSVGGQEINIQTLSHPVSARESGNVQAVPPPSRTHGVCDIGGTFGLLMMRDFQRWVESLNLCPELHLHMTALCMVARRSWRKPSLLTSGVPLGAGSSRVTVTTDSFLLG